MKLDFFKYLREAEKLIIIIYWNLCPGHLLENKITFGNRITSVFEHKHGHLHKIHTSG